MEELLARQKTLMLSTLTSNHNPMNKMKVR